jgi:hypothetical protein
MAVLIGHEDRVVYVVVGWRVVPATYSGSLIPSIIDLQVIRTYQ